MMKTDIIIAVKDVEASSKWYQSVLACKSKHGGSEFDVLVSEEGEILLCLHKWGAHEHPTMINPDNTVGNGLILYFKTDNLHEIYENVKKLGFKIEEEIHLNLNSSKKEFAMRDIDGYFLIISEYHIYEG